MQPTPIPDTPAPFGSAYPLPADWTPDALHIAVWWDDDPTHVYGPFTTLQDALDVFHSLILPGATLLVNGLDPDGRGDTWQSTFDAWTPDASDTDAEDCRDSFDTDRDEYYATCAAEARALCRFGAS